MRIPSPDDGLLPEIPARAVAERVAASLGPAAFDRCFEASRALRRALRDAGHDARPVQVAGMRAEAPGADPRWLRLPRSVWQHYLVEVDGTAYDLAARQFGPDAPAVATTDMDSLAGIWETVYAGDDAPDFR